MNKIIIENRTKLAMEEVLSYVEEVVLAGRISNYGTEYCNVTTFSSNVVVLASKNKKSDRFVVIDESES